MTGQGGDRGRDTPEAVSYAIGHRIRVEILAALHDLGSASAIELARVVHQPLSTVTHHVGELLKSDSILIDRTERVRSVEQRFYRVIGPRFTSDEEMLEKTEEERQETYRVALEAMLAEVLAGFWAGKLPADPRAFLCWNWLNVDARGRDEIADEQLRSWRRLEEIQAAADARRAESGEDPITVVVTSTGFERPRAAPHPPFPPQGPVTVRENPF